MAPRVGLYAVATALALASDRSTTSTRILGGSRSSTAVYFDPQTPIPLLEMYTGGITFRTCRVNARALIPTVLALVVAGRLRPELVTDTTPVWDDAAEQLPHQRYKAVITRD